MGDHGKYKEYRNIKYFENPIIVYDFVFYNIFCGIVK